MVRTLHRVSLALVLVALVWSPLGPTGAERAEVEQGAGGEPFAAAEVLVRWRDEPFGPALREAGVGHSEMLAAGLSRVRVPRGWEAEAARRLGARPEVLWAQPDYIRTTQTGPNDPRFTEQWALEKIKAPTAWDTTTGAETVIVAVLDTGVDLEHPDLQGRLVPGRNFLQKDSPPQDDGGHGTHVAGTIAATLNNNIGVAGVAAGASIMPLKVLNSRGAGRDSTVATGVRWATDNGARIINMSFGGTQISPVLTEAVAYATSRGVVIVVAAGNEATSQPNYPAATEPAIAVAATNPRDEKPGFSNYGPWIALSAPGSSILSTHWDGSASYRWMSGTSMAAPHVTGVIALLLSIRPSLTIAEVGEILRSTADPLGDTTLGAGRLNAAQAIATALSWSPEDAAAVRSRKTSTLASISASVAPTLYLPAIVRNTGGWSARVEIQNTSTAPASVLMRFIAEDGSVPGARMFALEPGSSATAQVEAPDFSPATWQGAAIITSNVPVAASVAIEKRGSDAIAYEGQVGGAVAAQVPLVFKNAGGWNSTVHVHNLGSEAARVELVYTSSADPSVTWIDSAAIPSFASRSFRPEANPLLPEGYSGGASVRSADGQRIAVMVSHTSMSGQASAYITRPEGAAVLPLILADAGR